VLYLVERAGESLAKTELIAGIWPNLVVEENSLNKTCGPNALMPDAALAGLTGAKPMAPR
jgi:hypothetical protein